MESRVGAMALAHEMLYESDNLSRIDLGSYLEATVNLALQSRNASVKYAFPNRRDGFIHPSMHLCVVGHVKLEYGDDGVGMPVDFVPDQERHLGLILIKSLIERQLRYRDSPKVAVSSCYYT